MTLSGKLVNTSGSTIAAGTAIAQAPDGYRPPFRLSFTIWAGTAGAILADVLTNGQVVIVSYDFLNGAYVSLDGICYQAV